MTVDEHKSISKNLMERLINVDTKWGDCVEYPKGGGPVSMIELDKVETALKHT